VRLSECGRVGHKRNLWPVSNPGCRGLNIHCSDLAILASTEGDAH